MRTLRINITLEREPGVATVHIRLGNWWAKATLRNVSNDQLRSIAMGDPEVLPTLLRAAGERGEAWTKAGPKAPFEPWANRARQNERTDNRRKKESK